MKSKILAAALLSFSALSNATTYPNGYNIDYAISAQDTNGDTFTGHAVYNTTMDIFISASGTFTYADAYTSSSVTTLDAIAYTGYTGSQLAGIIFNPPAVWVDAIVDLTTYGGLALVLASSPNTPDPVIDAQSYIDDNTTQLGLDYSLVSASMTADSITYVPEPATGALLAAGLLGVGVSRRKAAR